MKAVIEILLISIAMIVYSLKVNSQEIVRSYSDISFYQILNDIEISTQENQEQVEGDEPINRWLWFWRNRVDGKGRFTPYSEEIYTKAQKPKLGNLKSSSSYFWSAIGPTSDPTYDPLPCDYNKTTGVGQARSIWANSTTLYAGLNAGGFWKWNGSSWSNFTNEIPTFSVYDIAVDNSGKIYLATGYSGSLKDTYGFGYGVIYSTDGGNTWVSDKMTGIPAEELLIQKIIIHPTQQNIIYALSRHTVFKSENGGNTWTNTFAPTLPAPGVNTHYYIDMDMKEDDPNTLFICSGGYYESNLNLWHPGKIYKSTDGAISWESTDLALNLKYGTNIPHLIGMSTTQDDPTALYVVYRDNSYNSTLEKSTDNGNTWSTLVDHKYVWVDTYIPHILAISPSNSNNIFTGGGRLYKYDDINKRFIEKGTNLTIHDDIRDIFIKTVSGVETIYIGDDSGVAYSQDNGSTWQKIHDDLQGGLLFGVSISEITNDKIIAGFGDCGTNLLDGAQWKHMCIGGDGGTCLIDYQNNLKMFAMSNGAYKKTLDGGQNWSGTTEEGGEYATPIIQNLASGRVYIAWRVDWPCKVKYTDDFGTNWDDYPYTTFGGERITAMAISQSDTNYFYLATVYYLGTPSGWYITSKLRRTINSGNSEFQEIYSNLGEVIHEGRILDIEIHPLDPNIVWICFGGMMSGNKVFHTINGGSTWQNVTYDLENFPVMDIEYDHDNHRVYIATDIGPYYMDYGGNSWNRMGDLPITIVTELKLNHNTGNLYASTWGRGLWKTTISGHCFDGTNEIITSNTTWSGEIELCKNLIIQSGTITIQGNCIMPFKANITVKTGASLNINGGTIQNADIIVESGGNLIIQNNGKLIINNDDELQVNTGGILDYSYGDVEIVSGY